MKIVAPATRYAALLAIVAAAAAVQFLLTQLKFSSAKGEWIFRSLFLAAALFDLWLARRRQGARAWLCAVPVLAVALLLWLVLGEADAQGAIFVFLLPFLQLAMSAILALILAADQRSP
jgi:hypothetical protein